MGLGVTLGQRKTLSLWHDTARRSSRDQPDGQCEEKTIEPFIKDTIVPGTLVYMERRGCQVLVATALGASRAVTGGWPRTTCMHLRERNPQSACSTIHAQ